MAIQKWWGNLVAPVKLGIILIALGCVIVIVLRIFRVELMGAGLLMWFLPMLLGGFVIYNYQKTYKS